MLEGLDKVDWSQYSHHIYLHHGEDAADVPQWIRDLLDEDEDIREQASFDLMGEGQDFGAVTEATAHFIPFLVEFLSVEGSEIRWEILYFLGEVAVKGLKSQENATECVEVIRQYVPIYRTLINDEHNETQMFARRLIHLLETGEDTLRDG